MEGWKKGWHKKRKKGRGRKMVPANRRAIDEERCFNLTAQTRREVEGAQTVFAE